MDAQTVDPSHRQYDYDNIFRQCDLELKETPVKVLATYNYKKLQSMVSVLGLPANLKRKQLLAILIAKKMGKDVMIPAILQEVLRERSERKKNTNNGYTKRKPNMSHRLFPPNYGPLPPQVLPINPVEKRIDCQNDVENVVNQCVQEFTEEINAMDCFTDFNNDQHEYHEDIIPSVQTNFINYYETNDNFTPVEHQNAQIPVTKTTTTIPTYTYEYASSNTNSNFFGHVWMYLFSQILMTEVESTTNYYTNDQQYCNKFFKGNVSCEEEILDDILDLVMEKEMNNVVETVSEDFTLNYKQYEIHTSKGRSSVLYGTAKTNNSFEFFTAQANLFQCIPHVIENPTRYSSKVCIYSDTQNNATIPNNYLLYPEHQLTFDRPQLFYTSREHKNDELSASLKNMIPLQNNEPGCSFTQVHYNVVVPTNTSESESNETNTNYVELKNSRVEKRTQKGVSVDEIEPTYVIYDNNVLDYVYETAKDYYPRDYRMDLKSKCHHDSIHKNYCCGTRVSCPFLNTLCDWHDIIPEIGRHIKLMHSEKIVTKSIAEYCISFKQLELFKVRGANILQQIENRLCYVSIKCYENCLFATVQEICENVDNHADQINCKMVLKHSSGTKVWSGVVNPLYISISNLWTKSIGIIFPYDILDKVHPKYFNLVVSLEIQ